MESITDSFFFRANYILYYGNYELNEEVNIMNVEKIIRTLGYIVYTALWSPIIVLLITIVPVVWFAMCIRNAVPIKEGYAAFKRLLMAGIQHDVNFIRTGKW